MERKNLQNSSNDMRDQISEWWDEFGADDLDLINGDQEKLISILQERYGYSRNIAFLASMEIKLHMAGSLRKQKRIAPLVI
jgi:hypothetical protein